MIRTAFFTPDAGLRTGLAIAEFPAAMQDPIGVLWVDFENNPPEEDELILRETFGFHPLAIDDALQESHVPKLDDWGEFLYIVLHSVLFNQENGGDIDTLELDVFLGKNYMVTHHDKPISAVEKVWSSIQRDDRPLKSGVDRLLYKLVDEVAASYMPVVEEIDEAVDRAEDQVFSNPDPHILEQIFNLKRATLHLRRVIGPQREVLNKLARDDIAVIDIRARVYFRDVYDHLVRLQDITESIRDLVSGTLDTYLSVINNRMNDIMKTLTLITTLFMPISFIASFFGMNFFSPVVDFPRWTGLPAFYMTLALVIIMPLSMYLWMRSKRWM
jgi:magnesium transporter